MTAILAHEAEWVINSFRAELAALPEAREPAAGKRKMIGPGIWTTSRRRWRHASVFDTAAELPTVAAEPRERLFPRAGWQEQAACREMEIARFFGEDNPVRQPSLPLRVLLATRSVCVECPVRAECIEHSLTKPEYYGVWGGVSRRQRLPVLDALDRMNASAREAHIATIVEQWTR